MDETWIAPVAIYKTTDGGVTWTPSVIPVNFQGAVTKISMIDSLTGYASIFSDIPFDYNRSFGRSCLWKTTDGGNTWFDDLHLDHIATSVYAQNGLLVLTKWDYAYQSLNIPPIDQMGGGYSYDAGVTWTEGFPAGTGNGGNDVAFSDSLNGVLTQMNDNIGGGNFWMTTDAGRTWQQSLSKQYEAWSTYAVPGRHIYFCANESQPGLPHASINWSSDGGFTWQQRASFADMHFTGGIAGAGNTLYFQTDSTYNGNPNFLYGMYRSDDLGATWHFVHGPAHSRDSRFVVTGCNGQVVYAFDGQGGVWKTTDGGDGTLKGSVALSIDTLSLLPNPCGDTIQFPAFGDNCIPVTIDSAAIVSGTELLSIADSTNFPKILSEQDSVSIRALFSPTSDGQDTAVVRIYGHSGQDTVIRDMIIETNSALPGGLELSSDTCSFKVGACSVGIDTVLLSGPGCSGMMLDSIVLSDGEIVLLDTFPQFIANGASLPVAISYAPDSAEHRSIAAQVFAHVGRRSYETTLAIAAQSIQQPPIFVLSDTLVALETRYCHPVVGSFSFLTTSCDSVTLDSIVSSSSAFTVSGVSRVLAPSALDTISVVYNPGASADSGQLHLYARHRNHAFDTAITVMGTNITNPQTLVLSRTIMSLATAGCAPIQDTFTISDQGCETLTLDSAIDKDSTISISFDSLKNTIAGGDSLVVRIQFDPSDSISKSGSVRLFAHTASKSFDTTVSLALSNNIPSQPLALSADSIFLFTKYCQPVALPIVISNSGCKAMAVDSVSIAGDTLQEFSYRVGDSLLSEQSDSMSIAFTPAFAGQRAVRARLYLHAGIRRFDTVLSITGKNLTAPVPMIPALTSLLAGKELLIPILLEPTTDTFSIRSYAFHLSFNTDLLTPERLEFSNTCSSVVDSFRFVAEPGSGCSGRVWLRDTISDSSRLDLPLIYVRTLVSLTRDSVTDVLLDTFVTDREPGLELCNIPEQPFQIALACGDPTLLDLLNTRTLSFDVISVAPNPAHSTVWSVQYVVHDAPSDLSLELYDETGALVRSMKSLPAAPGEHDVTMTTPLGPGNYILVLENGRERTARRVSVLR